MAINYLRNIEQRTHVSNDIIYEFESMLSNHSKITDVKKLLLDDYLLRLNFKFPKFKLPLFHKEITFSMLMGVGDFRFYIRYYKTHRTNAIYLFDAWPQYHDYIKFACESLNIKYLFCSSKIATENLAKKLNKTVVIWQPEAINCSFYKHVNYKEKDIDVLQIGRKYSKIQNDLVLHFEKSSIKYIYQKKHLIFPNRNNFINGLASSKISLCFPRSLTHPEVAGNQETMTVRYLQSMASKTLVVGKCPEEMKLLFPYNPVIDLDLSQPGDHIQDILNNYEHYIPLIERNYQEVNKNHQWKNRWDNMINYLVE